MANLWLQKLGPFITTLGVNKKNKACACVPTQCGAYGRLGRNPQKGLPLVEFLVVHWVCDVFK